MLFSKQVLSIHLSTPKKEFLPLCPLPLITRVQVSCLSLLSIDIVYLLAMHATGYMHSFLFIYAFLVVSSFGMKLAWLTLVQALRRLNSSPL